MSDKAVRLMPALRYRDGTTETFEDPVVVEDVVTLHFNGTRYLSIVATNDSLTELGAGFFIAAGLARSVSSVTVDGLDVYVEGEALAQASGCMESAGGLAPAPADPSAVIPVGPERMTPDEIFRIRASLDGDTWEQTGGLHCTALYYRHRVVRLFSDIGRHNTVDKAIGYMVLQGFDPQECAIGSTGREPVGMVRKAVNAGIPIVVSRAAATTAGIGLAETAGVTLICFTRDRRFTVYAHPERIRFT